MKKANIYLAFILCIYFTNTHAQGVIKFEYVGTHVNSVDQLLVVSSKNDLKGQIDSSSYLSMLHSVPIVIDRKKTLEIKNYISSKKIKKHSSDEAGLLLVTLSSEKNEYLLTDKKELEDFLKPFILFLDKWKSDKSIAKLQEELKNYLDLPNDYRLK